MTGSSEMLAADASPRFKVRLLRRFSFSQRDGLIVLLGFLWSAALLEPFGSLLMSRGAFGAVGGTFILSTIGGCLAALAFAAGRNRLTKSAGIGVFLGCLAAFVVAYIAERHVFSGLYSSYRSGNDLRGGFGGNMDRAAIVYVVGFLLIWLTTLGVSRLANWIRSKFFVGVKFSRARGLVSFAVVLFIAQLIQKIFFTGDSRFGLSGEFAATSWPIIFGGGLALGCAVVAGNFLTDSFWKLRWKLVLICLLVVVCGFMAESSRGPYRNGLQLWSVVGFVFAFLWTLLIANGVTHEVSDGPRPMNRLGFWSILPVALLGCVAFAVWSFDAIVLQDSQFQDWTLSRRVRTIRRVSGGQVRLDTQRFNGLVYNSALCRLREDADRNVLGCLSTEAFAGLTISGLTPRIDTGPIKARANFLQLEDSKVSTSQLKDLIEAIGFGKTLRNVEVVDSKNTVDLSNVSQFSIECDQRGQLASILRTIGPVGSQTHIDVFAKQYSAEDLKEMIRLSERCSIVVGDELVGSLPGANPFADQSPGRLVLNLGRSGRPFAEATTGELDDRVRFVLQNDLFVIVPFSLPRPLFWDLVFAKNIDCFGGFQVSALNNRMYRDPWEPAGRIDLNRQAEEFHWSFGRNANGQITELYLPCGERFVEDLSLPDRKPLATVEVLGFDPYWLTGIDAKSAFWKANGQWGASREVTGNSFSAMPNLKRLDLSPSSAVTNVNILNLIPNIEHLQIRFDESTKSKVDFSVCKKLKTLIYFGTPPKSTMIQLGTLKQLERVTVVNPGDGSLFQAAAVKNVENSIPGLKVEVIEESRFEVTPPDSFLVHVKKKSTEIREKLLKMDSD